jgi:phage internal scaffolding protein
MFNTAYKKEYKPSKVKTFDPAERITEQSHKDACDVNILMDKLKKGLPIDSSLYKEGKYGYVEPQTYSEALIALRNAKDAFDDLPAKVRQRFDNDPAKLLEFIADDKNREEAEKLGLVKPGEVIKPIEVKVIEEPKKEEEKE